MLVDLDMDEVREEMAEKAENTSKFSVHFAMSSKLSVVAIELWTCVHG